MTDREKIKLIQTNYRYKLKEICNQANIDYKIVRSYNCGATKALNYYTHKQLEKYLKTFKDFSEEDFLEEENYKITNHNSFILKINEMSPTIEILSKYEKTSKPISCKCLICNNLWNATPSNLLRGENCPKCATIKKTKTTNQFSKELTQKGFNIILLSDYINAKSKIQCKCLECSNIWETTPDNLLKSKFGCPECAKHKKIKTNLEATIFLKRLNQIFPSITLLTPYVLSNKKVLCTCEICGYKWEQLPYHLLSGKGCPSCGKNISKGEQKIEKILQNSSIKYETQFKNKCIYPWTNRHARFDFYLPDHNCLIEYDGEQHFLPIFKGEEGLKDTQKRDSFKNQWCKENYINLIRIPYTHFKNICLEDLLPNTSSFLI